MIKAAKKIIVVADHTKLGRLSLHSVAEVGTFHELVTGKEAKKLNLEDWERTGIKVHLA